MTFGILIDMNLSPEWAPRLRAAGWQGTHWSEIGDPRASDAEIMLYAKANGMVVLTHDLDFGALLALTHAEGPSVLQLRGANVLPEMAARTIVNALKANESALSDGALVVVDPGRSRVRVLPL